MDSPKNTVGSKENRAKILHKMKSPLTSINGYAELIATKLKNGGADPKLLQWSECIKNDAKSLLSMIEELEKESA